MISGAIVTNSPYGRLFPLLSFRPLEFNEPEHNKRKCLAPGNAHTGVLLGAYKGLGHPRIGWDI